MEVKEIKYPKRCSCGNSNKIKFKILNKQGNLLKFECGNCGNTITIPQ